MIILLLFLLFFPQLTKSNEFSALVLMYHRFDQAKYPSTSISSDLFEKHLKLIKQNNFNVLPLNELVNILKNKKTIPEKSILITVDDGFKSFYKNAFPLLIKYDFPFSIFISTGSVTNEKSSDYMSWEMLREISQNNGLILNHTIDHESLLNLNESEIIYQVKGAQKKIEKELGATDLIFSYPFGESSIDIENILEKVEVQAAFSQYSAPIDINDSLLRLPRFALNDLYGKIDRFKMILNTQKLPIKNISFKDAITKKKKINISFESDKSLQGLNCYVNQNTKLTQSIQANKISIELDNLEVGKRHRLNCTLIEKKKIFWFGKMIKRIS